jgi:hypothetical protein
MKIKANNVRDYVISNFKLEHGTYENAFQKLANIKMPFDEFSISVDELKEDGGEGTVVMYFKKIKDGITADEYFVDLWVYRKDYKNSFCRARFMVKKNGRPVIRRNGSEYSIFDMEALNKGKKQETTEIAHTFLYVALLTVQFMHFKNVKIVESETPIIRSAKKGTLKKKRVPTIKHYTLDIEPLKKVIKKEGCIIENGIQKALHVCRGHFRDYTEKGLFGKILGKVWVNAHNRGNKQNGEIVKEYNLKLMEDKE